MALDAIVVGAGLAGLACAGQLQERGLDVRVLEAADGVGGRVRTDEVDGFRIDRGFQVFLTAYPEARRVLDLAALDLRSFTAGALVRAEGGFARVLDPRRHPLRALAGVAAPVGSLGDKLRVGRLRGEVRQGDLDALWARPETTTAERLRAAGMSDRMIDTFFRPWLGGIFLESELVTSRRMLAFVFGMFAKGDEALPVLELPPALRTSRLAGTGQVGLVILPVLAHDGGRLTGPAGAAGAE